MDRLSPPGQAAYHGPGITSPAEWQTRVDLAACYQLCALYGWDDGIYTHISAAVPGEPGHYLINAFGMRFDEVRASNLVKVDGGGNIAGPSQYTVNASGFRLHGAVHRARPDAGCVMHLHNLAGMAVGMQEGGLLPLSPYALRFYGVLAFHDYEGIAMTEDEQERLVADLGAAHAMLLRNHGSMTVGRTIAEAFVLMETLDRACEVQLRAQAAMTPLRQPSEAMCRKAHAQLLGDGSAEGVLEWPSLLRRLDAAAPRYRT
ncbi:class II aldolase/adducin family protein [Pseudoduganella umbonata]|uniref:Class II aldolase/adducin family protein n=1 Tax=Pseudoduganella umbonata TaxID=864828 RepID=A0A4P8HKE0_9BURK|nr:class II aldolase/adducin family protein [Pseudoduganella umbonata]MBB3220051.1 ribulose-5-phosphate 4-epimerase/fuculose-1-phosphate aldolase [Pseudoduganella umbonata]QCP10057.1 class II aldolase/adducin family protein [Pseudoduganella umbonata]